MAVAVLVSGLADAVDVDVILGTELQNVGVLHALGHLLGLLVVADEFVADVLVEGVREVGVGGLDLGLELEEQLLLQDAGRVDQHLHRRGHCVQVQLHGVLVVDHLLALHLQYLVD